ncbi:MAG: disulfide bond formation protein DsbA [Chthoniobacterales bacterium]|nr:MAG: disulfide bond formation protein DsbA [Chthoniobacterales bacterium]
MRRYLPFAIIAAVFCIATIAGVGLYQSRAQAPVKTGKLVFGQPGANPPHMHGSRKAPVALEEFGDFECMPCSLFWPVLKQAQKEYGDRLSVTFREYPLTKHTHALDAARAAEAAGLQGRFWEMHDALYGDRLLWLGAGDTRAALILCASHVEIDLERFKKDLDSEEVSKRIAADRERVASLELDRTPAVFVNGDRLTTAPITIEILRAAIDDALGVKPK